MGTNVEESVEASSYMEEDKTNTTAEEHEELLSNTLETLRNESETDVGLLDILSRHIVRLNPAGTAVDDALTEIEDLAKQRTEESE